MGMLQVKLYNDDAGNRVLARGEDADELKLFATKYHLDEYEEELTWSLQSGQWVSQYEAGMQYAVEAAEGIQL